MEALISKKRERKMREDEGQEEKIGKLLGVKKSEKNLRRGKSRRKDRKTFRSEKSEKNLRRGR